MPWIEKEINWKQIEGDSDVPHSALRLWNAWPGAWSQSEWTFQRAFQLVGCAILGCQTPSEVHTPWLDPEVNPLICSDKKPPMFHLKLTWLHQLSLFPFALWHIFSTKLKWEINIHFCVCTLCCSLLRRKVLRSPYLFLIAILMCTVVCCSSNHSTSQAGVRHVVHCFLLNFLQ